MIKNLYWSLCKVPIIFFLILMNLEISRQIFEKKKHSNAKFHAYFSSGS